MRAALSENVAEGEESGGIWVEDPSGGEEEEGVEGGGVVVARREENPGSAASWSNSLRTSLASLVQRVMFSHTPSLSFARRPRLLVTDRLLFFCAARLSELPRRGRRRGELTGVPYSDPIVARDEVDPADEDE